MADSETNTILDGDLCTLTASFEKMSDIDTPLRELTFRVQESATSSVPWGVLKGDGTVKQVNYLKTDESWTIGPSAGTVRPSDIYVKGTAGDVVWWAGVKA